jgi:hypothetical protein
MQIDLKPCGAQRGSNYFMASGYRRPGGFKGRGKTEWNFSYDGQSFDSDRWEDLKTHQPFYPRINLKETHRKFQAPKRANPVIVPPHYPDHPVTRQEWVDYLDSAPELGRKIGLILNQLEAEGASRQYHRHVLRRSPAGARPRQAVLLPQRSAHPLAQELSSAEEL